MADDYLDGIVNRYKAAAEAKEPFVSMCCEGERCFCGQAAEHKVEETVFDDDPIQHRHPLTRYICHKHFRQIMGPAADRRP